MRKTGNTIYIIIVAALLLTVAVPLSPYAQTATGDSVYQYEDSVVNAPPVADSAADDYDSLNEAYEPAQAEPLYFLRKEDTTSLFDSSVTAWRAVPDSVVQSLKKDGAFWYADKDMEKKEDTGKLSRGDRIFIGLLRLLANPVFRQILWIIIIGGFAAAVIWFLVQNQMNIFGRGRKPLVIRKTETEATEDMLSANLEKAADDAAAKGDFRLAVRFRYLHLLKTFSQQELLQYRKDATNIDYLKQLYDRPYYKDFFKVTRHYEYAWYGGMPVSAQQYEFVTHAFNDLYQKASVHP
ncbi:MAG: DUF4129 domain-containing protein [Sphingobacteriales bacterium]|nr:DUF4129 domain-containing protein [Sphingobacteriales bacterium]OJY90058.1 MAG: hypothetical protein BGP14_10130 [Sphingobacteriales bacterium 44-15]